MWTIPLGQITQLHYGSGPITLADLVELGRRRPHVRGKDAYAKYDALLDRFRAEINEYLDELIAGQRSPYSFLRGMQAAVRAHYPDFYGYGQQVLDPRAVGFTQEDLAAIHAQEQREFGFLGKWYAQLKEKLGGPYERQAIEEAVGQMRVRADLYAQAGRTLFFQGQVSLVSETTLIWWNLWPPAHHCWRCPEIAAGSPYTKRILPTLPGHDVPCMRRCKCFLTFGLPATLLELAILEADSEFVGVIVQWSYVRELHYGPGPHPGTGTPQSVHGRGGGGRKACRAPTAPTPMLSAEEKAQLQKMDDWLSEASYLHKDWVSATDMERASLKAQVARDLAAATGVSEQDASKFVQQWAFSSGDDDMRSLAVQRDAAKEFGINLSEFTKGKIKEREEYTKKQMDWLRSEGWSEEQLKTTADWERGHPLLDSNKQRALLRVMYDRTQAELKARGITEVRLHRGVKFSWEVDLDQDSIGRPIRIETNALSSWSLDQGEAEVFAKDRPSGWMGVVFETIVPADRILSTPHTGFGCLIEGEVVVIGGGADDTAMIVDIYGL